MSLSLSENATAPGLLQDGMQARMSPHETNDAGAGMLSSDLSEDNLHHPFSAFDHSTVVVQPYRQEAAMDAEYQERKILILHTSLRSSF